MQKVIDLIIKIVLVLLPVFFLTLTPEFYDFNKHALLAIALIVISVLLLLLYAKTKKINLVQTSLNVPVLLFCAAALLTLFINSPNKAESLFFPNGTGTVVLLTLWYFFVLNISDTQKVHKYMNMLTISASLLSVLAILQYFRIGTNLFFSKELWISQQLWTPVGSPLVLALFLASILPYPIVRAFQLIRSKEHNHSAESKLSSQRLLSFGVGATAIIFALALLSASLLTTSKPIILPFNIGWEIGAETLKSMRTAALGVGMLNYLPAFTTGHTQAYNALPIWNIRFGVGSNWYLQILTELGIIGLIAFILIVVRVVKKTITYLKETLNNSAPSNSILIGIMLSLLVTLVLQLFLPASFIQLFLLFTLLALFAKFFVIKQFTEDSSVLFYLITIISFITIFVTTGALYKVYAAEVHLKNSLNAAQRKDIDTMYKQQQQAIKSNPYIDKYHAVFAQSNLAYAIAISKKENLSEGDKQNISKLLAQAVQSGKFAISAYPSKVNNWENLAGTYRSMIGAVKGADAWSVQAYQQAMRLDPMNPNIRMALGGVYYRAKNYDVAIEYFSQAASLKPNLANAHYNLSASYREKKEWEKAAVSMQRVIQIVSANSEDRKKAEAELEEIKKNLPPQSNTPKGKELINEGQNTDQVGTPVDVPENAAPNDLIRETPRPSVSPSTR